MINAVYIHIPFCTQICTYCDFCKFIYNEKWIKEYLRALKKEIKQRYKNEKISSIYIGGGTPSALKIEDLKELFEIISSFNLNDNVEFTIECNTEDLTKEKLELFRKNDVNRLSIGIQTFNKKMLEKLNRKLNLNNLKLAFEMFDNINLDLMYALPNQNIEDLKKDISEVLKFRPKHISFYSLILEENTILYINKIKEIDDDIQREMYEYICDELNVHGYNHYEISNFAKDGYESKHNLVYWNNENYYGFGLGAFGYINNIRYENTRSINKYLNGNYILEKEVIDLNRKLEDEFMLGFRKINGINKKNFYEKYKIDIKNIEIVKDLLIKNILSETTENIFINKKYIYVSNEILEKFINSDLLVH